MNTTISSFEPIVCDSPRIMILGTMPSVKSLEKAEYYAHPQNAFWPMIVLFAGVSKPEQYVEKRALIQKMGIVLWDVCATCSRQGSLDSAIRNEVPNDILSLLVNYPSVRAIFFNGQPVEKLFRRHFPNLMSVDLITLPSTSPANTFSFEKKCEKWHRALTDYL